MKTAISLTLMTACLLVAYVGFVAIQGDAPESSAAAAAAMTTGDEPVAAEIKIDDFAFDPPTITVKVGTKITWVNRDDIPHTVVSDGNFKSGKLDTDGTFTFTAQQAGTFAYVCSIHPTMKGKIVVE